LSFETRLRTSSPLAPPPFIQGGGPGGKSGPWPADRNGRKALLDFPPARLMENNIM
jgi:hypothetical protein